MEGRKSPHLDMLFPRRIPGSTLKNSLPASRIYTDRRPLWLENVVIQRRIYCVIRKSIEAVARAAQAYGGFMAAMQEQAEARQKLYAARYEAAFGLAESADSTDG